jgi:deoxycytidylate deaminase
MYNLISLADPYRDYAIKTAERHTTSVHIALVVKRGKVIAVGTNGIGTRSSGCGYGSHGTIHAEKAVMKNLGDMTSLRGAILLVLRMGRSDHTWRYSAPCHSCKVFLNKCIGIYGLKTVYYSYGPDGVGCRGGDTCFCDGCCQTQTQA